MATKKKTAAKKPRGPAKAGKVPAAKVPGIGRSAITGKFMSVASAKAHKKTALVEGAGKKKRK